MGSLGEAACGRDWPGGLGLAHSSCSSVQISSMDLFEFSRRVNRTSLPYARAMRAATVEPQRKLWGHWARRPAVGIGQVGLVSLTPVAARCKFRVWIYSNSAAALTGLVCLTRARGAPPRSSRSVSYGVTGRGGLRSGLARWAWSRSLQLQLGANFEYGFIRIQPPR